MEILPQHEDVFRFERDKLDPLLRARLFSVPARHTNHPRGGIAGHYLHSALGQVNRIDTRSAIDFQNALARVETLVHISPHHFPLCPPHNRMSKDLVISLGEQVKSCKIRWGRSRGNVHESSNLLCREHRLHTLPRVSDTLPQLSGHRRVLEILGGVQETV